ncbi:MAG: ATP-binding protein [Bacillota bacterium]|nr:ATP-binding protein [Bacillota bacterium]
MRDLSLHLLDIARNSIAAKSTEINIEIIEDIKNDLLVMTIKDNGIGMNQETIDRVLDPFFTTRKTRNVGLGLSLLKANCRITGGDLEISSALNIGTFVKGTLVFSNIDRPPLGNIAATITCLILSEEEFNLSFTYQYNDLSFSFSTNEIQEILGNDVDIKDWSIINWIESYINENIESLKKA